MNAIRKSLFIEPFCGGASVAIALLEAGLVSEIALNDADYAIAAFWDTVFDGAKARWLAGQVMSVPLTLDEWGRQKAICPSSTREAALRCLYLNRTSFNGILQARGGPIGGRTQVNRTLGARFNREAIAARILQLAELSERVVAVDGDYWYSFVARFLENERAVFYLDPPFYHKAERLYEHYFDEREHVFLRDALTKWSVPWLLSYDDAPEVRALYACLPLRSRVIDSTYSAHPVGGGSFVGRELLYSNLRRLPATGFSNGEHEGFSVLSGRGSRMRVGDGPVRRPNSAAALQAQTVD